GSRCACAVDGLGGTQADLQGGDGLSVSSLDQEQGGQFVALALFVGELGLVGLSGMSVVTALGPIVDGQSPGVGVPSAPVVDQLVQGLDQCGQVGARVVEEAMGSQHGGKAVGQATDGQGVDTCGQGIAHVQVLQDQLAVATLQT